VYVTTSWDDGDPASVRVAEVLARHGLKGTFYVAPGNRERAVMRGSELGTLAAMGMEIGAHTLTHRVIVRVPREEACREVREGKDVLEQALGESVRSFAYPKGRFSERAADVVAEAGFTYARTTVGLQAVVPSHLMRATVSLQLYPHDASTTLRHAARSGSWEALGGFLRQLPRSPQQWEPLALLEHFLRTARALGDAGLVHLWGHAWELDSLEGGWQLLESACQLLASAHGAIPVTNGELVAIAGRLSLDGRPQASSEVASPRI
jgi:peptidoglycan/xylan/chitin deacetylase (PgdA/CDA1 family)